MVAKTTYSSVEELIRSTTDDPAFAEEASSHLAERTIVSHLFALRNAKGLSQADIAKKMKCSQSRISKLENGTDNDLRLGDFAEYLHSLDFDVKIMVHRSGATIVDEIKHHIFSIKRLMDYLASIASGDDSMMRGVFKFIQKAAFNLECLLSDSISKLNIPAQPEHPRISMEVEDFDEDVSHCQDESEAMVAS